VSQASERRREYRVRLQWPVRLYVSGSHEEITTHTENLSSAGFYCYCPTPFTPGEHLRCVIHVPGWRRSEPEGGIELQCAVKVLRVERLPDNGHFGIAFGIQDYSAKAGAREVA